MEHDPRVKRKQLLPKNANPQSIVEASIEQLSRIAGPVAFVAALVGLFLLL